MNEFSDLLGSAQQFYNMVVNRNLSLTDHERERKDLQIQGLYDIGRETGISEKDITKAIMAKVR